MKTIKSLIVLILFLSLLIFLFSCSPQKKLAKTFIQSKDSINLLLLNSVDDVLIAIDTASFMQNNDSSMNFLLPKVNTVTAKNILYMVMYDELKKYNIHLSNESDMSKFLSTNNHGRIFNMVQIQLEESAILYTDSREYDSKVYEKDYNLRNIGLNTWFETSQINDTSENISIVLYSSLEDNDKVDGSFKIDFFTSEVEYNFYKQELAKEKIYDLAYLSGSKNASYIFDFFLNEYIHKNYKGKKPLKYYHYELSTGKISPAVNDRFIFM